MILKRKNSKMDMKVVRVVRIVVAVASLMRVGSKMMKKINKKLMMKIKISMIYLRIFSILWQLIKLRELFHPE